jgi:hypothetical protein
VRTINQGVDPLEAKRRRKADPLVKDLALEWLDKHAAGLKSEHAIRALIGGDLANSIGNLKVTDVRRRDVIEAVEAKAKGAPRQAAIMLVYARKLYLEWTPGNDFAVVKANANNPDGINQKQNPNPKNGLGQPQNRVGSRLLATKTNPKIGTSLVYHP